MYPDKVTLYLFSMDTDEAIYIMQLTIDRVSEGTPNDHKKFQTQKLDVPSSEDAV